MAVHAPFGCWLQPTQMLCNQLAKAWSRQGEVGEVRAVMANMRSSDVKTDLFTWSSLVHACAIAGQMGKSVKLDARLLLLQACVALCCCCNHVLHYAAAATICCNHVLHCAAAAMGCSSCAVMPPVLHYSKLGSSLGVVVTLQVCHA